MKRTLYILSMVVVNQISFSCWVNARMIDGEEEDRCKSQIEKVVKNHNTTFSKDKNFTVTTRSLTIENGANGEWLTTKFWKSGEKYKLENPFMTLYMDANEHVIILNDSRAVIVRSNSYDGESSSNSGVSLSGEMEMDSLIGLTEDISCGHDKDHGELLLNFPEESWKKLNYLRSAILYYDHNTGAIRKTQYEYRHEDNSSIQITEYLDYSNKLGSSVFTGSATDQVMKNGKINVAFEDYEWQDMRKAQTP